MEQLTFYSIDKKIRVFELYLPKFEFTNFLKILLTKFAYFLHEIIFNIFVKKFFRSFVCLIINTATFAYLKKMFKMSSFCLHASPEELVHSRGFDAWSFTFGLH